MKAMFKTITISISMAMLLLAMTACGGSDAVITQTETSAQVDQNIEVPQSALEKEQATSGLGASDMGPDKIKQIVLAKVPGAVEASIYEFEREIDDGRVEYEGSLYHNGYEYEFEIDGATGNILKWEIDD